MDVVDAVVLKQLSEGSLEFSTVVGQYFARAAMASDDLQLKEVGDSGGLLVRDGGV